MQTFVIIIYTKKFYSIHKLKKSNIVIFPILKLAANPPDIGRVGKLEADIQQVPLVYIFFFLKLAQYSLSWNINHSESAKELKKKKSFLR